MSMTMCMQIQCNRSYELLVVLKLLGRLITTLQVSRYPEAHLPLAVYVLYVFMSPLQDMLVGCF